MVGKRGFSATATGALIFIGIACASTAIRRERCHYAGRDPVDRSPSLHPSLVCLPFASFALEDWGPSLDAAKPVRPHFRPSGTLAFLRFWRRVYRSPRGVAPIACDTTPDLSLANRTSSSRLRSEACDFQPQRRCGC